MAHTGLQGSALPRAQWPWDSRGPFSWFRDSGPHPACSGLDQVSALLDASPAVAGLVVPCWAGGVGGRKPGRAALSDGEERTPGPRWLGRGREPLQGGGGAGRAAPVVGWVVSDAPGLSSSGEHVALIE